MKRSGGVAILRLWNEDRIDVRAVIAAAIVTMLVDLLDVGPIGREPDWDDDWDV